MTSQMAYSEGRSSATVNIPDRTLILKAKTHGRQEKARPLTIIEIPLKIHHSHQSDACPPRRRAAADNTQRMIKRPADADDRAWPSMTYPADRCSTRLVRDASFSRLPASPDTERSVVLLRLVIDNGAPIVVVNTERQTLRAALLEFCDKRENCWDS